MRMRGGGTRVYLVSGKVDLWKSDGTEAGTVMVKDINFAGSSYPEEMIAVGDVLYFQATDGSHGPEKPAERGHFRGSCLTGR